MLEALLTIAVNNLEIAKQITTYQWFTDNVDDSDLVTARTIVEEYTDDTEKAVRVLEIRSRAGDVVNRGNSLRWLFRIAGTDPELAQTAMEYARSQEGDLQEHLLTGLVGFSARPREKEWLISQDWFADGLSAEEAAAVVPLRSTFQDSPLQKIVAPNLLPGLLKQYYVQSKTISLPLAGEVNIWAFQNLPFSEDDDIPSAIEATARFTEQFFGSPFPTTDIIALLIVPTPGDTVYGWWAGLYENSHILILRPTASSNVDEIIYHEVAHYYASPDFGPRWLGEGTADSMRSYVADREGSYSLSERKTAVADAVESQCRLRHGVDNLHELNNTELYLTDIPELCFYWMGENLLHSVVAVVGEEVVSAVLGDIYSQDIPANEERVYRTFLRHIPSEQHGTFQDIYRRLHGGPHAAELVDVPDDHADTAAGATPVVVGEALGGMLDHTSDSDFFRIQLEAGTAYRIDMSHEMQGLVDLTVRDPNGSTSTYDCDQRALCERTSSSLQVYGRSFDTGEHHISIQNSGGYTGRYTITVTRTNIPDDHGSRRSDATDISLGEVVTGSIEDAIDEDYFRFRAELGQKYRAEFTFSDPIRATGQHGRYPIVETHVEPELGGLILRSITDTVVGNRISEEWTSPASDNYYFVVYGLNGGTGTYTFTITPVE